jgi:Flp pilus assembly pilin Flp
MKSVLTQLSRFWRDDAGQDLIEYALLAGLISTVATLTITSIGTSINDFFLVKVSNSLKDANK